MRILVDTEQGIIDAMAENPGAYARRLADGTTEIQTGDDIPEHAQAIQL